MQQPCNSQIHSLSSLRFAYVVLRPTPATLRELRSNSRASLPFISFPLRLRRTSSDFGYVTTTLSSVMHKQQPKPNPNMVNEGLIALNVECSATRRSSLHFFHRSRQRTRQQGHSLSRYAVHSGCVSGFHAPLSFRREAFAHSRGGLAR